MKSFGGVFALVYSDANLAKALDDTLRGKAVTKEAEEFVIKKEDELSRLAYELREGTYRPGRYSQFRIRDPKPRLISCAPFRDRVDLPPGFGPTQALVFSRPQYHSEC